MDRQLIIDKLNSITNPYSEKMILYEIMDELGMHYRRTNCKSCIFDYYNIVREELGMIEDASEESNFDYQYELVYTYPRPVNWKGTIVNKNSPKSVLQAFYNEHPKFFMRQLKLDI